MDNLSFEGQLGTKKGFLKAKLEMYLFLEDNTYIIYCPALDLSAFGDTKEEAKSSFTKTFEIHFSYCINKGTLFEDLKQHGWLIKSKKKFNVEAPKISKMIKSNKELKEIIYNKEYERYDEIVGIPQLI